MLSKWQLSRNMSEFTYDINMPIYCCVLEEILLLLYRTLRQYYSWRRQMCKELQHMEMLPGILNEDNDGKCTLLSNVRSQSDVHFDTYQQRQDALK